MAERNVGKRNMTGDTLVYMLAKGCEGILGVITLSVMSKIYSPDKIGMYSVINIAVTTIAMFACQWLVQSVMRYINKYEIQHRLKEFYSTAFISWLRVNLLIIFLAVLLLLGLKGFGGSFLENYPITVLTAASFMFVTYSAAQLIIAMLAAVRRAKTNLFLSVTNTCGKLILLVILTKIWGSRVEFIFISYCLLDLFTVVFGTVKLNMFKYIDHKCFNREVFMDLFAYGFPLMGNLITTQVLNKSDIYIITILRSEYDSGIYQANYSIISSAFTMLAAAVMRGSYPTILRSWSEGRREQAGQLVNDAVRMYLLLGVPAVCGVFALQDVISGVLFSPAYHSGNIIMGPVALGMLFLAITEYSIKGWELNSMTKQIFYRSLVGGVINVAVNLALVPVFGFAAAGWSTFAGFFIYFLLARYGTRNLLKFKLPAKTYARIIGSGLIMAAVLMGLKQFLPYNKMSLFIMIAAGMVIYFGGVILSGEVKDEAAMFMRKIRK